MAKEQVNATDVAVRKLEIYSASGRFNLAPNFLELNLYENIFRPCMTANITLSDSHNIPKKLPIIGEETVDIDIAIKGFDGGKDEKLISITPPPFHVNSMSNRSYTKLKAQIFTLDLISEQYMSSLHSKVSKSYKNERISDVVEDIYKKYIDDGTGDFNAEPTDNVETLIIPNLSPFDAIKWLSKRAIQGNSNSVNYVFYENMNGTNFVSLDYLSSADPICTFLTKARIDDPSGVGHMAEKVFKIEKFTFLNQFDKIKNTKRGVYAAKLITHDIVRKKLVQYDYNSFNEWFASSHVGLFPTQSNSAVETKSASVKRTSFSPGDSENSFKITDEQALGDQVDSRVEFYPKHKEMYAKNTHDYYNNNVENWKLRRNGHVGVYDGITLLLDVSGNSLLRVGHIVTLFLPSPETSEVDGQVDQISDTLLSGKYMVTAIQHSFTRIKRDDPKVTYTMRVEVVKDGLEEMVEVRETRKED